MRFARLAVVALLGGVALLVAAACDEGVTPTIAPPLTVTPIPSSSASPSPTGTASPTATATGSETAAPTDTASPAPGGAIEVETGDNFYGGAGVQNGGTAGQSATIEAAAGPVQLHVKNTGAAIHNLHIMGIEKTTGFLNAGTEETLDLGEVAAGQYAFVCDFHPTEMLGTLNVN